MSTMPEDYYSERPLFGGAIATAFPLRFQDVSNTRQVPDHQEAYVDPDRDESLLVELLDLKHDVADNGSATWFLQDLSTEQDAEGFTVIEQSGVFEVEGLRCRNMPGIITTAVGQMAISKGRQGREAQNIVKVYLANLRLKEVGTDVLVTAYEPVLINSFSESARAVGAGLAVPAVQSGRMPMSEVFKLAVSTFKIWMLLTWDTQKLFNASSLTQQEQDMSSGNFFSVVLKNIDVLAGPVITLAYPLYASINAIETKSLADDQQWLTYWVIYSLITLFELTFAKLIEWFPIWPYAKLLAICWLVLPYFSGATYVYEHFIRPFYKNPQIKIWYFPVNKNIFSRQPDDILTAAEKYIEENGPEAFERIISRADSNARNRRGNYMVFDDDYGY